MSTRAASTSHFWTGQGAEGGLTPSLPSSLTFLAAVWLGFAPFTLHYDFASYGAAVDINDVLVALVVGALALWRVVAPRDLPWLSIVNAVLGAWLVASTVVLDHGGAREANAAIVNDLVVGLLLVGLGTYSAVLTYRARAAQRD